MKHPRLQGSAWLIVVLTFGFISPIAGQVERVPFDSPAWNLDEAEVVDHLGRTSLRGTALLGEVVFEDGVIEVDIAVTGSRSYPGIFFRRHSAENMERFYIRPHRAGLYSDALQYTPVFNGIAGWQLYSGPGFTASSEIPIDQWIHVRLEVQGRRARVFIDDRPEPALTIDDLQRGPGGGAIGLMGPKDGSAHFSNFGLEMNAELEFGPPPDYETRPGMLTGWELSNAFGFSRIDVERTPQQQGLDDPGWRKVSSDRSGLVDIARFLERPGRESSWAWARTVIRTSEARVMQLRFGYSDQVSLFLNGDLLYTGDSSYRSRDSGFSGIIGLLDVVHLPLKKGANEVLVAVGESFGGWGFMAQDGDAVYQHGDLRALWDLSSTFNYPESAVYDRQRDVLYISSYFNGGDEYISRVTVDGTVVDLKWITGLNMPTGLCLLDDRLYVVERRNLVEIDLASGSIAARHPFPEPGFANDAACAPHGDIFVSDSGKNLIYRLSDGTMEEWLSSTEIVSPNGLDLDGDALAVGASGDGCLKRVGLEDRAVSIVACFGKDAVIDGVRSDGDGGFIVSVFEGRVFHVSRGGRKTALLDTRPGRTACADLEYIADKNLLIVPTLQTNQLRAYRLERGKE